jgi:autotransporter-associated beta strand protein
VRTFSILLLLGLATGVAQAQTWIGTADGNWSTSANWTPGIPVSSPTTALIFNGYGSFTYTATNNIGNPFQLNSLTFQNNSTGLVTVTSAAGNQIQFDGANPVINVIGTGDATLAAAAGSSIVLHAATGTVTLGGSGVGNLTISAPISGNQALRINAPTQTINAKIITLSGANTFTGGLTLDSGNLRIGNASALGTGSVVINGGVLETSSPLTVSNNIALNSDLHFEATNTGPLTLSGILSGVGGIRLGTQTNFGGQLALTLTGTNTFTGGITLETPVMMGQGTVVPPNPAVLTVNSTGSITTAGNINIRSGGTLAVTDSNNSGIARLNSSSNLTLSAGNFIYTGGTVGHNEVVNALILDGGGNQVRINADPAAPSSVTFSQLIRNNRGNALFGGSNFGNVPGPGVGSIFFNTAPTLVGGGGAAGSTNISILPYALHYDAGAEPDNLITYDANGARPLNVNTEYAQSFAGIAGTTTQTNVRVSSADLATPATTTINSLMVTNGGTIANSQGGSLTVASGAIIGLASGNSPTINVNLNFGTTEGIITGGATINGTISGSAGLTAGFLGGLTLTAANTYTGPTTLNAALLTFTSAANLGGSTSIIATGDNENRRSELLYTGPGALTLSQSIDVVSGLLRLETTGAPLTLSGSIVGGGGLNLTAGTIVLTSNNSTYTGETRINNATLKFGSDAALGNGGGLNLGGSIGLTGPWTTSRPINISVANPSIIGQIDTGGFDATWNGPMTGTAQFLKAGAGTLTLGSTANAFNGQFTVAAGRLNVDGILPGSVNAFTINAGAALGGTGTINRSVTDNGVFNAGHANAPGVLSINNTVVFGAGSTFVVELQGTSPGSGYDQLALIAPNSTYALGGTTLQGVHLNGFVANFLDAFVIVNNSNPTPNSGAGTFSGLPDGTLFNFDGQTFQIRYNVGTFSVTPQNGLVTLTPGGSIVIAAVPEPTTLVLLVLGASGAVGAVWYRRRKQAEIDEYYL